MQINAVIVVAKKKKKLFGWTAFSMIRHRQGRHTHTRTVSIRSCVDVYIMIFYTMYIISFVTFIRVLMIYGEKYLLNNNAG